MTQVTRRGLLATLAAGAVLFTGAGFAVAGPPRPATLEVTVILASQSDGGLSIDPALRDLPHLTRDQPFVRYNTYRLLERRQSPLEVSHPVVMGLPNGRTLEVRLDAVSLERAEKRYQLEVQIGEPGRQAFLKSLHVTTSELEPFFVGGQSHLGGTMFIELMVRP